MSVDPVGSNLYPGVILGDPTINDLGRYLPIYDWRRHTRWADDFHNYVAGDWTLTETDSAATEALTSGHGGLLLLTNTGADNDVTSLQYGTTSFAFAAGRKAWMGWRVTASEATDFELLLGLSATDTSPIQSLPSDGVFFYKADDAATWQFQSRASSSALVTQAAIATLTAGTYQVLEMYYDGGSNIVLFVDGKPVASPSAAAFASLFGTSALRVTMACQAGAAAAKTMTVDYGYVMMERA